MIRACFAVALAGLVPVAAMSQADHVTNSSAPVAATQAGLPDAELLAKQLRCIACHTAEGQAADRLQPKHAPSLKSIGERRSPGWIASYLTREQSPHPRVLARDTSLANEQAAAIATTLTASDSLQFEARESSQEQQAEGAQLFQEIGCFACHADDFGGRDLAAAWSLAELTGALKNPEQHPTMAGRMPDLGLDQEEAGAIAAWLLRGQVADGPEEAIPGLHYAYYEEPNWPPEGLDFNTLKAVQRGTTANVTLDLAKRPEKFGMVFEGILKIERAGEYQFWTVSDDGSELFIDGERVVDNLGHHAPLREDSEPIQLSAGWHDLCINFFEQAGGETLEVGWSGPGFDERAFQPSELAHWGQVPHRESRPALEIAGGEDLIRGLNCAACHDGIDQYGPQASETAQSLAKLPTTQAGCLAPNPGDAMPDFKLDSAQRELLVNLLRNRSDLDSARGDASEIYVQMNAHQCTACHSRDGVGAPSDAVLASFVGADDLGEEGRVPPSLDDVGAKLKEGALGHAIAHGQQYRPGMRARMPAFRAVDKQLSWDLTAAFRAVDPAPETRAAPQFSADEAKLGQRLAGTQGGLACIACHGANGHPSVGVQGPSLSDMAERLQFEWYAHWMADPTKVRPGTRMLNVFGSGRSPITDVHGGDPAKQIDALWQYMSLGESMPLPPGLVPEAGAYALIPTDHPIYFGTFFEDASARVLTVGFPERVSIAFDMHNVQLFEAWRGDFIDAQGTWDGRAGGLESAAGTGRLQIPNPILMYKDRELPESGREIFKMLGHDRDPHGHPTFRYLLKDGNVEVAESITPRLSEGGASLLRKIELRAPNPVQGLLIRTIEPGEANRVRLIPVEWEFDPDTQAPVFVYEEELKW